MTELKKINKIEILTESQVSDILSNLILKMGYIIVDKNEEFISANIESPLFTGKHVFIIFNLQLSGKLDFEQIKLKINNILGRDKFSAVFIISKFHISKGFKETLSKSLDINVSFLDRDDLVTQLDKYNPDYWKHDDVQLLDYEKSYKDLILNESELKSLKIFSEKYQKLLDIFIEPRIVYFYEDLETRTPLKKNISIESIVNDNKPLVLSGEAGMGKSTLLKKIGETIIDNNKQNSKKNLPIFISVTELFDSNYDLNVLIETKLNNYFNEEIEVLFETYDFTLLVDSIDEFELEHQKTIVKALNQLYEKFKVKYILATRNSEKSLSIEYLKNWKSYSIARFSNQQMEQFISRFFISEKGRAEKLLDALRENRIIEKLPITPLSLSLISILFEENDLEIPATITDIYENFNSLLLGKPLVSSRVEFIDISFKERILSLYALELLQRREHNPMKLDEFINHFATYYQNKSNPLKKGTIEEALNYLVLNTGVLYLKNNTYVCFNHDSFMEYYAAVEIFKHQRGVEKDYITNFFDSNWQNSAVFYAGHSKDMFEFLSQINKKIDSSTQLNDYFSSISGAGYILQALYQTDNVLRKETIDLSLEINLRALDLFMKLASDDKMLFKNFKLPIIWLMNMVFFYENFNSGTLREPLKMSFEAIKEKYLESNEDTNLGYKALMLALTLSSNRINEKSELNDLIYDTTLLDDAVLAIITELSLSIITNGEMKELKKDVKKEFNKNKSQLKHLLDSPASKLRFSHYDKISSTKRVKIITEGKTDATIIEHAFMTLTNGDAPYWSVKPSGNESGNARQVNQSLMNVKCINFDDEIIIGIFDHDSEGIKEFNMLSKDIFLNIKNNSVKKHKDSEIYAILLPIPGEKQNYLVDDQKNNYFEIEHYLPLDFLKENDALKNTLLSDSHGIYSIKDGKKNAISKKVTESSDRKLFLDFIHLFEEIDSIAGVNLMYQ